MTQRVESSTSLQILGMFSLATSAVFGIFLGCAIAEHASGTCLAGFSALTTATFVFGLYMLYAGREKKVASEFDLEQIRRENKLLKIGLIVSAILTTVFATGLGYALLEHGSAGCLVGNAVLGSAFLVLTCSLLQKIRKNFHHKMETQLNDSSMISQFTSEEQAIVVYNNGVKCDETNKLKPIYKVLLRQGDALDRYAKTIHFRKSNIEMVDQVRHEDHYFVRRRVVDRKTAIMTTELSRPMDAYLNSVTAYLNLSY